VRFAFAFHGESFVAVCKKIIGKRLTVSEGQDVVHVAPKNDDTDFVLSVLVHTITFGHIE